MPFTNTVNGGGVFQWLEDSARRRERAGLTRRIRPREAAQDAIDLSSNDYVSLAAHPEVTAAAAAAVTRWGAGATAARLVSGTTPVHIELEEELADFCGVEAAVVFTSGYMANLGALTALCRSRSLIVADAFSHASLIDGCRLSSADVVMAPHNDVPAARAELAARGTRRATMVTESIFSVDGDRASLAELVGACRHEGVPLVVDDAHGLGVLGEGGRGALHAVGLAGAPDIVITGTLGKSLGAQGGMVMGPRRVIDHVVNMARPFLFDTGLAPSSAAAALAALRILRSEPERPQRTRHAATDLASRLAAVGLHTSTPEAAVISVRAPSAHEAVAWAAACREQGVLVSCFRPPSVPDRFSRLRISVRADLSSADLARAARVIADTRP